MLLAVQGLKKQSIRFRELRLSVSLLTNSMGVEGNADPREVMRAVEEAGYGIEEKKKAGDQKNRSDNSAVEDALLDRETPVLKEIVRISWIFDRAYVFFHGDYDVGLAGAKVFGRKSCSYGTFAVVVICDHYGNQPKSFLSADLKG